MSVCKECRSACLLEDHYSGDVVCTSCGLVQSSHIIGDNINNIEANDVHIDGEINRLNITHGMKLHIMNEMQIHSISLNRSCYIIAFAYICTKNAQQVFDIKDAMKQLNLSSNKLKTIHSCIKQFDSTDRVSVIKMCIRSIGTKMKITHEIIHKACEFVDYHKKNISDIPKSSKIIASKILEKYSKKNLNYINVNFK
uniref:TFIIB-type domain-containing protein n=1 Tax=viral metagenome TaxID=1070528 RepID=A0A6C0F619_9ZZZZ|tara:strand:- start:16873 stop:17463 length:591 start_codon:yes stop_codon:yes gene_type:complete